MYLNEDTAYSSEVKFISLVFLQLKYAQINIDLAPLARYAQTISGEKFYRIMETFTHPKVIFSGTTLTGKPVQKLTRTIGDLKGLFADQNAFEKQDTNQIAYEVESYLPVPEGTEGGLFFGITRMQPGTIGNEYMITKGHSHVLENRAEFYWCIEGEGMMLFMDKDRNMWAEKMFPGSLHFIEGHTSHRVANTGVSVLSFGACWPSDAGHNYELIAKNGFSKRLMKVNGEPQLV